MSTSCANILTFKTYFNCSKLSDNCELRHCAALAHCCLFTCTYGARVVLLGGKRAKGLRYQISIGLSVSSYVIN